jgi:hypothetical protein
MNDGCQELGVGGNGELFNAHSFSLTRRKEFWGWVEMTVVHYLIPLNCSLKTIKMKAGYVVQW